MVALTDLAPSTQTVSVGGKDVSVYGISAKGLAALLTRFPGLAAAFLGHGTTQFEVADILNMGPDVVANIIAAGCGLPGDEKALEVAASLPIGDQVKFLQPILKLSMPDGPGPLVDALNAIVGGKLSGDRGKDPGTKSPSPSNP